MNESSIMMDSNMQDFFYDLPASRIAMTPCEPRDQSRLLVYSKGAITHTRYSCLADHLHSPARLVFNNTRVIPARMHFERGSGATIEVFLLEPASGDYHQLHQQSPVLWKAMVGGLKKWPPNKSLTRTIHLGGRPLTVAIELIEKKEDHCIVNLIWEGDCTCLEIIDHIGSIPLPPYIKRQVEENDKQRYQTVYAAHDGSVAAPTAGLHFTPHLLDSLNEKGISTNYLTLHVGAGTFKPVKSATIAAHQMHQEQFEVGTALLQSLIEADEMHVAVGTTTLRTLESLYWMAVKAMQLNTTQLAQWELGQWEHVELSKHATCSRKEAFLFLIDCLDKQNQQELKGRTSICITPGYRFQTVNALITNFHQPHSTLLLLIAAILGEDWKRVYHEAMENDYRFLSYGDGSLLFINQ